MFLESASLLSQSATLTPLLLRVGLAEIYTEASSPHVLIMGAANSGCRHFWMPLVVDVANSGCLQLWMPQSVDVANSGCRQLWMLSAGSPSNNVAHSEVLDNSP